MNGEILATRDYGVAYATGRGPLQVLEGVSLGVGPGEVLGLVGESGSGKSTLAYAVMRTLRAPVAAESGDILLGGVALRGLDENRLAFPSREPPRQRDQRFAACEPP